MLYLAAIFLPSIAFAWTRRPGWTVFSIFALPFLAIITLSIAYWVTVIAAWRTVSAFKAQQQEADFDRVVAQVKATN